MKKDFVKVLLIFVICIILAFGACFLCACLFDRVQPLASAETVTLPDNGVVGENILYNSDFSSPIFDTPSSSSLPNLTTQGFYNWYATNLVYSNGVSFSVSSSWRGLDYFIVFPSNGIYTFSICVKSSVLFTQGLRVYNGSSWVSSGFSNISASNDFAVYSSTFTVSDRSLPSLIYLWCSAPGSVSIQWCKLEFGSEFTGYVPNYDEIEQNTLIDYFDYNAGWTNYSVMGDFLHDDSELQYLSSPNGGSISYVGSTNGTLLTSSSNGTQFVYSPNQFQAWSRNHDYTVAILINGTFTTGDVVLTLKYSQYSSYNEYWQGSDPVALSDQYNLSSGLSLYQLSSNGTANMTLTLRSGVSIYLLAYKVETGTVFTRFPYSTHADYTSFSNGYNAGLIAGTEQGYSQGLDEGYNDGYNEGYDRGEEVFYPQGYTNGYNDGILTADEGTWNNMLSSLINLPVTFILSLIHFEILGFDFANVFRIIVLFSLLSFIITKVLKGII